ncbi:MAG: diaminopimelate decarboxylase [Acholeplasmataceae bacterium]
MELFGTQNVNEDGILTIGGCLTTDLVKSYGTPLYVMDETHIRSQCQWFTNHFKSKDIETEIIYASKAFLTLAMVKLIEAEGLSIDVVSGGELYTAIKANFPMDKVYFHGNNKSQSEIEMALAHRVKTIVCDHIDEVDLLIETIQDSQHIDVLLRINPGIEAHTHEYIKTTKNDSKFGVSIFDDQTFEIIKKINAHSNLNFLGFHSHIGSQIFETHSFFDHASVVLAYAKKIKETLGIDIKHINLGGGFGVKYTENDRPITAETFLSDLLDHISKEVKHLNISAPKISIEPGRAIVANAGTTLYQVATTKQTFGDKKYVFVDGSMADHIRTVLYQAVYHAKLANRMHDTNVAHYTVTGKACESGDIIIRDAFLPIPSKGDILAVFTTGAYHYSMASNYNRLTKPAVVFVKDGKAKIVVKRETYDDLLRNDCLDGDIL